jgi:branched-subunit amino acid transport protein
MGVTNFLLRGSFLLVLENLGLPPIVQRALRFVPPAVFAALVVPELVLSGGTLNVQPTNAKLIAGLVAGIVGWRTRNALATIGAGMVMLHVARFLGAS